MAIMKKIFLVLSIFVVAILLLGLVSMLDLGRRPDIEDELNAFSIYGLGSKTYHMIYVGEKKIQVPVDSTVFKFDPQMEKPQVKVWLEKKEVAKRAEIWLKDKDQLREYLR